MTMKNEDDTEDKTHSAFFKKGTGRQVSLHVCIANYPARSIR